MDELNSPADASSNQAQVIPPGIVDMHCHVAGIGAGGGGGFRPSG